MGLMEVLGDTSEQPPTRPLPYRLGIAHPLVPAALSWLAGAAKKGIAHRFRRSCVFDNGSTMHEIKRGSGTTPSERYLATIADRNFLNLWSYPNLFADRRSGNKGDGKELCDLLVVCGDHVLIFSDKSIDWPNGADKLTRQAGAGSKIGPIFTGAGQTRKRMSRRFPRRRAGLAPSAHRAITLGRTWPSSRPS